MTNGRLKLNQKPVGQDKLDWAAITVDNNTAGFGFALNVDADTSLEVSGDATIDFDGLLSVQGSFLLTQFDLTDDTIVGAGATALSLQLSVSDEVGGAASASGNLNLLQVSNASGQTWLGVAATELNFDLNFAPLTLAVTNGSLKLNQKPVGQDKLDWAAITVDNLSLIHI